MICYTNIIFSEGGWGVNEQHPLFVNMCDNVGTLYWSVEDQKRRWGIDQSMELIERVKVAKQ